MLSPSKNLILGNEPLYSVRGWFLSRISLNRNLWLLDRTENSVADLLTS